MKIVSVFFTLFLFALSLFLCPSRHVLAQPQPATLNSVNVSFELPGHCDDRDDNTRTKIWVTDSTGNTIAENDDVAPGIHLKDDVDPSNFYGPYSIPLQSTVASTAWSATTTHIHIDPHGHDTWCVKFHVDALFSDNSHTKSNNCNPIKISEANRDYSFATTQCTE